MFHKTTQQIRKQCQYLVSGATWWQAVQPTFQREKYTENVALHHSCVELITHNIIAFQSRIHHVNKVRKSIVYDI